MSKLSDLQGTEWVGTSELWLDPLGNQASVSECRIRIGVNSVEYSWSHQGEGHSGRVDLSGDGAEFTDTFHSPSPMKCSNSAQSRALFEVTGAYGGPGQEWGWRIALARRPSEMTEAMGGELVLQMTNLAPWGEEGRAVRMVCSRG